MKTFYNERTALVEKGIAVDIFYPGFSKAFDTVSHKMLIEKLMKHRLDEQTARWAAAPRGLQSVPRNQVGGQ